MSLKPGKSLVVKTKIEREQAYDAIKTLKELQLLSHEIKSTTTGTGFKFYAI